MKIFKFGGASVKNADGVRNVASILNRYPSEKLLVVISAMGKTTNLLETLVNAYFHKTGQETAILAELKKYHYDIINDLSQGSDYPIFHDVENLFLELECLIETPLQQEDYDFIYDQIVSFGELFSTRIVSNYLHSAGVKNQWIDSRNFILTDDRYRDARIQWDETGHIIGRRLRPLAEKNLVITQGFIGRGPHNETTTLGREGSDYSAAIFAFCLQAQSVTIWKDVAGVMNADPKKFPDATLISELSYTDAIELAYYGASVIHPKTIQPLKAGNVPLYVRSFLNPEAAGTSVSNDAAPLNMACYIHKEGQVLAELSTRDFTFIVEKNLESIFSLLAKYKVRCNIMQNSAISFSFVADKKEDRLEKLSAELQSLGLQITLRENLELLTVYNADSLKASPVPIGMNILLEQKTGPTVHYLLSGE